MKYSAKGMPSALKPFIFSAVTWSQQTNHMFSRITSRSTTRRPLKKNKPNNYSKNKLLPFNFTFLPARLQTKERETSLPTQAAKNKGLLNKDMPLF